jgi:uncharacterized protein (TIGR00730 family)
MTMRIAVYCGASPRVEGKYLDAARAFGATLANGGVGVVYGGCKTGLMGAVADGALDAGGDVIGVLPDVLSNNPYAMELAHPGLTQLLRVPDMHTRKAVMTAYADAFVALPGGFGTLDELFEALTWRMIGTHQKPIGLFDVDGYWRHLVAFIDHATTEKLVSDSARAYVIVDDEASRLLAKLLPSHSR